MIITRLIDFLETRARLGTLIILLMAMIPINTLIVPLLNAQISKDSAIGRVDSQFYFTPAQLFEHLQAYGESGRRVYLISIVLVDFIYPILYALFFSFFLTLLLRAGFAAESPIRRTQLLPFGMLMFNYFTNISIAAILIRFPAQPVWLAWIASGASTLKWCFGFFTALALTLGIGRLLIAFSKSNRQPGE